MRIVIFLLTILAFVVCKNQRDGKGNSANFGTCFVNIDTSIAGQSIACSGGAYKLINDRYVLRLLFDFPIGLDSCHTIFIDSLKGMKLAELLVFENRNASLANICTDVIVANYPEPSRELYAQSGELVFLFSDPTEYYGNQTHHTTVLVKKLVFIDGDLGNKIELRDELLWKVLDLGTPG